MIAELEVAITLAGEASQTGYLACFYTLKGSTQNTEAMMCLEMVLASYLEVRTFLGSL